MLGHDENDGPSYIRETVDGEFHNIQCLGICSTDVRVPTMLDITFTHYNDTHIIYKRAHSTISLT
jgi:hypothetical protein